MLGLLAATAATAADDVLGQADSLMAQGRADAAYQLLKPLELTRAGNPEFDYRLGIAALDSGRASDAVFALERVLAVDPDHTQARAELGRAHFALGEMESAREAFETAEKAADVPEEVRFEFDRYLDAIEQRVGLRPDKRFSAYAALTLGYDTNVNSATGTREVAIPLFGGAIATLDEASLANDDVVGTVAVGGTYKRPLRKGLKLVATANAYQRRNNTHRSFDTASINARVGLTLSKGRDAYTAAVHGEHFMVDRDGFRNAFGVVGQWRRLLDPHTQVSAYGQATRLKYPGQSNRNANRYTLGGAVTHAFDHKRSPVVYAGLYGGEENVNDSGRNDLDYRFIGARFGGRMKWRANTDVFAAGDVELRDYYGTNAFFLREREDKRFGLRLGADYKPARRWTVTPAASFTRNNSNIVVNDYDRVAVSVTLQRAFN